MGTDFAPNYACLTIGFLEETKLLPELHDKFGQDHCNRIKDNFFRYLDDGFTLWSTTLDIDLFKDILNGLHPNIKYTFEQSENITYHDGSIVKRLNFLDISILLHSNGIIETDIYFKPTNTHDYLQFHSQHPEHIKKNIPYNLAKKIIVFCTSPHTEKLRLNELKDSLLKCEYPLSVINKAIHNASLQGPSNDPSKKPKVLPFVTSYNCDLDSKRTISLAKDQFENARDNRIKEVFQDYTPILALKQPANILRQITRAKFTTEEKDIEKGIFKCSNLRCKICIKYLQECKSFVGKNDKRWYVKSHITCHSKFVEYYLVCAFCGKETYTGRATDLRERTNNHISDCRTGNTTDIFDRHVHECMKICNKYTEPYFKLFVYMELSDASKLDAYEKHLHSLNYDTMN